MTNRQKACLWLHNVVVTFDPNPIGENLHHVGRNPQHLHHVGRNTIGFPFITPRNPLHPLQSPRHILEVIMPDHLDLPHRRHQTHHHLLIHRRLYLAAITRIAMVGIQLPLTVSKCAQPPLAGLPNTMIASRNKANIETVGITGIIGNMTNVETATNTEIIESTKKNTTRDRNHVDTIPVVLDLRMTLPPI